MTSLLTLRRTLPLVALIFATFLVGCATKSGSWQTARKGAVITVRTTAYTHNEKDHLIYGRKNAVGTILQSGKVKSAASDWSRIPLGTRFKVVETGDIYQIDDYGSALVGTNTVDLYKPTRRDMNRWGVRHVNIKILEVGSYEESRNVLEARRKHRHVDEMCRVMDERYGRRTSS